MEGAPSVESIAGRLNSGTHFYHQRRCGDPIIKIDRPKTCKEIQPEERGHTACLEKRRGQPQHLVRLAAWISVSVVGVGNRSVTRVVVA